MSLELWLKLSTLISTFFLLQYFIFDRTNTHLLLLMSFGRGLLEVLQQPPPWTVLVYTTGQKPLRHQIQESRKHEEMNCKHISPWNCDLSLLLELSSAQSGSVSAANHFRKLLTSQIDETYSFLCENLHLAFTWPDVTLPPRQITC